MKPKPTHFADVPLVAELAKDPLEVFRHVLSAPDTSDRTYEQREYRKWLDLDRKGFMAARHQLEKPGVGAAPVVGEEKAGEVDESVAEMLGAEWERLLRFREQEQNNGSVRQGADGAQVAGSDEPGDGRGVVEPDAGVIAVSQIGDADGGA